MKSIACFAASAMVWVWMVLPVQLSLREPGTTPPAGELSESWS